MFFNIICIFLSVGAFGKVFRVRSRSNQHQFALKLIKKSKHSTEHKESDIFEMIDTHPYLVELHQIYETKRYDCLLLSLCSAGSLHEISINRHWNSGKKTRQVYNEQTARVLLAELILAIEHIHNAGFIWRDLKPDNIMLNSLGHIQIIDLGLAQHKDNVTVEIVGADGFRSPEMLKGDKISQSSDIFNLGVYCTHVIKR